MLHGALLIAVFTEAGLARPVESPGAMGADIVVGEGQSIGNRPQLRRALCRALCHQAEICRQMPGRLCAARRWMPRASRGFVLTLSTREQHIRRDKATSNICTNSGLCCLAFTIHMTLLGEAGLRRLARDQPRQCREARRHAGRREGRRGAHEDLFQRIHHATLPARPRRHVRADGGEWRARAACLMPRLLPDAGLDDLLIVASTEVNTDEDRDGLRRSLSRPPPRLRPVLNPSTERAMLNNQGRPTAAGNAGAANHPPSPAIKRAADRGAADLRDRPRRYDRRRYRGAGRLSGRASAGSSARARSASSASRSRRRCAITCACRRRTYGIDTGLFSARLVHDEAQSPPQRENGAAAGLCRCPSAAAGLDGAGRAGVIRNSALLARRC